jgi:hypothetical protein
MIKRRLLRSVFGIIAVLAYILLTLISFLHYPSVFSPLNSSLSQLGDPLLNTSGAIFYNLGGILLGFLLIPFYIGMNSWNTGEYRQKILTVGGQSVGILSSLALVVSCLFPAGTHSSVHVLSAGCAGLTSFFFWIFSAFSMLRNPASVKWLPYFGYLPLASIFVLAFIPGEKFLIEWVSVFLFLVFVVLLACYGPGNSLARTHRLRLHASGG